MSIRKIELSVGNLPGPDAVMGSYKYYDGKTYLMPMYKLTASGTSDDGAPRQKEFDILRFGIKRDSAADAARVVGLAENQTHIIKAWLPWYRVHSAKSPENGAWQVYDDFLIHDGPDDPATEVFGSIGCVEICRGPMGFVAFNDFLISLSGSTKPTREQKLDEIGSSGMMSVRYFAAPRPALKTR